MIDLHTHTTASDGSVSPRDLLHLAVELGLEALAITDHDTLAGSDEAASYATDRGLDLICGIELSTRLDPGLLKLVQPWLGGRRVPSIHLLGYFLNVEPSADFRQWIVGHQESRRKRNVDLVEKLRALGLEITLPEVSQLGGNLTGRPHFAELLLRKGYVRTKQEAFDLYLADDARAAVERDEPGLVESIGVLRQAGALPVLAHPSRLPFADDRDPLRVLLEELCIAGLLGLEVWHSEHSAPRRTLYEQLASEFRLEATGGSDFHGSNKPSVRLGNGIDGNVTVPRTVLDSLRARADLLLGG
jgi:predicted metal-dependent phosphoesterase TrpH